MRDVIDKLAASQGWNDDTLLDLLFNFVKNEQLEDKVARYLEAVIDDEEGQQDLIRPLQESKTKKAEWKERTEKRLPIGMRVAVVASDESRYVGKTGVVVGYDLGVDGDWPGVVVEFGGGMKRDMFYSDGEETDEIVEYLNPNQTK